MPSVARKHQLQSSLLYHIMNRGNARQDIFHDEADYAYFEDLLARYAKAGELRIYHWALMSNHYHLCLEVPEPETLSRIFAGMQRAYVHYHHRKYQGAGFLFQGRFKSQPIQKERYLLACGRYIERNPVHARLVELAEGYAHSSARHYVLGTSDGLTTSSPLYERFGNTESSRQTAYRFFLGQLDEKEEARFDDMDFPQGDDAFSRRLLRKRGRLVGRRRGGNILIKKSQHIVEEIVA